MKLTRNPTHLLFLGQKKYNKCEAGNKGGGILDLCLSLCERQIYSVYYIFLGSNSINSFFTALHTTLYIHVFKMFERWLNTCIVVFHYILHLHDINHKELLLFICVLFTIICCWERSHSI